MQETKKKQLDFERAVAAEADGETRLNSSFR